MSEIEVPLEKVQEDIHHAAYHGEGDKFIGRAALLSAVLAVLAAVSALFAGHYANEAMIEQIQSSDHWAHYQSKGIKRVISELRAQMDKSDEAKEQVDSYKEDQEEIKQEAEAKEHESQEHLHRHETLAASVTFFQVAIGLTAIAVLTRRRPFLGISAVLGILGALLMIKGFFL